MIYVVYVNEMENLISKLWLVCITICSPISYLEHMANICTPSFAKFGKWQNFWRERKDIALVVRTGIAII